VAENRVRLAPFSQGKGIGCVAGPRGAALVSYVTCYASDFWWDLNPTAWSAVRSTLHLQQPDWQATAPRMVYRASGSALWALCYRQVSSCRHRYWLAYHVFFNLFFQSRIAYRINLPENYLSLNISKISEIRYSPFVMALLMLLPKFLSRKISPEKSLDFCLKNRSCDRL